VLRRDVTLTFSATTRADDGLDLAGQQTSGGRRRVQHQVTARARKNPNQYDNDLLKDVVDDQKKELELAELFPQGFLSLAWLCQSYQTSRTRSADDGDKAPINSARRLCAFRKTQCNLTIRMRSKFP
jgi:hypothetical protein